MLAIPQEPREREAARPISVTIVRVGGVRPPPDLEARLEREVIDVTVAVDHRPFAVAPDSDVALVYLPIGSTDLVLRDAVRWAGSGERTVALLGCCDGGSRRDTELALLAGFDDFVVGPISGRELAARVRALARRVRGRGPGASTGVRFGAIHLDPGSHQVAVGDRRCSLTRTEFLVMRALIAARGRALSRVEILDAAWGEDGLEIGERAVDNVVMRLRRKLGEKTIVTVRGVGFRLADQ